MFASEKRCTQCDEIGLDGQITLIKVKMLVCAQQISLSVEGKSPYFHILVLCPVKYLAEGINGAKAGKIHQNQLIILRERFPTNMPDGIFIGARVHAGILPNIHFICNFLKCAFTLRHQLAVDDTVKELHISAQVL